MGTSTSHNRCNCYSCCNHHSGCGHGMLDSLLRRSLSDGLLLVQCI
ncbi:hypothetical protein FHS76_004285 [Ochrobactrum daejeonense]|uniref:Uncharacterized protein n=1 Tax=Brucella daejeonensis TaxID=659015 RepID=A0A7W9ENB7_9HYPH|nr:hypothetical protein [Brucella daejeonensis]